MRVRNYIGCKVVQAQPKHLHDHLIDRGKVVEADVLDEPGYEVTYPDGYVSWSPRSVFDACYREISKDEAAMVVSNVEGD